jgi:A/G-specific adenine glycosylase
MAIVNSRNIFFFQKRLLVWYDLQGRSFPWRKKGLTQYQIIIAEVLLQRTKAETVARFYVKFIRDYPGWKFLANAELTAIEQYLVPVGLYRQRAMRLHNLAKEMVRRNNRLPRDRAELESIPFFGQYMANAVTLVIFGQPSPLIDVNMARVLERFFMERSMADIRYDPYLQDLAAKIVHHPRSRDLNWAILDFAALVCKARGPICEICMLAARCTYYQRASKI